MTTQTLSKIVERTRELLDEKQAAEYLTVSPGTLSVWRSTGRYSLPFVKVGRRVRYTERVPGETVRYSAACSSFSSSRGRSTICDRV
jgi:predicted site-specific integrase-resolvase